MSNKNDGSEIERHPQKATQQASDAVSNDGVVQNNSQQAVLNDALRSNPNKIPDGDSVGQHLVALKPGMTLSDAIEAQAKVENFGIDFGDGVVVTATDKRISKSSSNLSGELIAQATGDTANQTLENESSEIPTSRNGWKSRFREFDSWVQQRLNLSGPPSHDDYGRIVSDPDIPRERALCAALEYSFGMHNRDIAREQFAVDKSEGMLRRAQFFHLGPGPVDDIDGNTMSQNFINSCTMLDSIMHLAQTHDGRERIHNMITDNGDGTYDVKFPGQAANEPSIKVKGLTEGEKMLACESGHGDIYLAVLEKAMGQFCNSKVFLPWKHGTQVRADGLTLAMDGRAGLSSKDPVRLITGSEIKEISTKQFFTNNPDIDGVSKAALEAFKEHRVVLFGMKLTPGRNHPLHQDFVRHPNHAYLMTDCNSDGAAIRNPIEDEPREKLYTWAQLADVMSTVLVEDRSK